MSDVNTRVDVRITGVRTNADGTTEPVDFTSDQVSAVVVLTLRQHNPHMVIQKGLIVGEFTASNYISVMRALMDTWGKWRTLKAALRAALNLLPYVERRPDAE